MPLPSVCGLSCRPAVWKASPLICGASAKTRLSWSKLSNAEPWGTGAKENRTNHLPPLEFMQLIKLFLHFLARVLVRLRGYHLEPLLSPGPVLLLPNHVSWFDWIFVGVFLDNDWRFVTSS